MTIYVDDMRVPARVGKVNAVWSHMFSHPYDLTELDAFAVSIGLRVAWRQNSHGFVHYDVIEHKRKMAVARGAVEVSYRRDLPRYAAEIKAAYATTQSAPTA